MINKVAKGNRIELFARKELESLGYLVEKKNRSRFNSPDFWGLFDIIAIQGSVVRLIQIKSAASHFYKVRQDIKQWKKDHHVRIPVEIWLFIKRTKGKNEWRIEEY